MRERWRLRCKRESPGSTRSRSARVRHPLDLTYFDLLSDPGNDFVQYRAQAGGGFKSEHLFGLARIRRALLHVIFEWWIGNIAERFIIAMDLAPDGFGQLKNGSARWSRKIEILIDRTGMFQANFYSLGQIAAIRVVANLISRTENVEGILALEHFLRQIGHHMRHRQLHIAAINVMVMQRPLFSNADAIKRTHNGVRQLVLLPRPLNKILSRQLLKSVRRTRRGAAVLGAFGGGVFRGALEHHARRHHGYLLQLLVLMSIDGGIEGGGGDAFILRQQIVGELVEVADASDHRGGRDKVITVG